MCVCVCMRLQKTGFEILSGKTIFEAGGAVKDQKEH